MQETYIPLYRKYRPQKFADLVGQENLVKALSNAIKLNKIAHAYLFCGPRGTGKTSSARIFAKSLNCVNGPTTEPCGKCPSCINITNSTPVDVIEIDGASNRNVEHAQAILEKIQYAPIDGKYKIYIIDEVHMLSNTAFNALLKTLEEPPKNVIFILATTEVHKVLETIISRCQRFDFKRITNDDIVKRLEFIANEEKIKISKDALYNIAKSSQGGMRDSLALLDQVSILGLKDEIQSSDIDNILGKISVDELFEIVDYLKDTNSQNALLKVNQIYERGSEPAQIIENLIQYLRDLLVVKNTNDNNIILELSKLNEQNIEKMRPQAEFFENEALIFMLDKLMYYLKEIKNTTNRHLFLELAVVELANNNNYYSYKELIEKVQKLEQQLQSGNVQITAAPKMVNLPKPKVLQEKQEAKIQVAEQQSQQIEQPVEKPIADQKEEVVEIKAEEKEEQPKQDLVQAPSQMASAQQVSQNLNSQNGNWAELLENITSIPSRMFFNNLAKPIEITSNKITVGFTKETFVKQAKEATKKIPLENAAKQYFNTDTITIEIKLVDENFVSPTSQINPKAKQVSQPQTQQAQENSSDDDGYYDKLLEEKKEATKQQVVHSDGPKMIQELFDGKYL